MGIGLSFGPVTLYLFIIRDIIEAKPATKGIFEQCFNVLLRAYRKTDTRSSAHEMVITSSLVFQECFIEV
jgi:hypothetical protein